MSNILIAEDKTAPSYVEQFNSKIAIDVDQAGQYSGLKVLSSGKDYFIMTRSSRSEDITVNLILTIMSGNFSGSSIKRMERVSPMVPGTQRLSDQKIDTTSTNVFKSTVGVALNDIYMRAIGMHKVLSGEDVNLSPLGGKSIKDEIEESRREVSQLLQSYLQIYNKPLGSVSIDVNEILSFAMAKYAIELENLAMQNLNSLMMPIMSNVIIPEAKKLTKDLVNKTIQEWKDGIKSGDPREILGSSDYQALSSNLFKPLENMYRDMVVSANKSADVMISVVERVTDGYSKALDSVIKEGIDNYFISSTLKLATDSALQPSVIHMVSQYSSINAVAQAIPRAAKVFFHAIDDKVKNTSGENKSWNVVNIAPHLIQTKPMDTFQDRAMAASPSVNLLSLTKTAALELMANGKINDALVVTKIAANLSRADNFSTDNLNLLYFALQAVDSISTGEGGRAIKLTGIVSGRAKIGDSIRKIAFPLTKNIPILQDNLRVMTSIDKVVLMLEVKDEMLKEYSEAIMATLDLDSVRKKELSQFGEWGQFGKDGIMLRTCQSVADIIEVLQELFIISTAIAVGPYGKDLLISLSAAKQMEDLDERRQSLATEVKKSIDWYSATVQKHKGQLPQSAYTKDWMSQLRAHTITSMRDIDDYYNSVYIPSLEAVREAGAYMGQLMRSGNLPNSFAQLVYAKVRSQTFDSCPFGLIIPKGCQSAGRFIDKLDPVLQNDKEEEAAKKEASNRYKLHEAIEDSKIEPCKCKYLRSLMEEHNVPSVVCNWGEGDGLGHDSIDFTEGLGAYYPNTFMSGLFSLPSALGPEGRESWFARSPGTTPFGQTSWTTPGL